MNDKNENKVSYEVIDNFLPSDVLDEMQTILLPQPSEFVKNQDPIHWIYTSSVVTARTKGKEDWRLFYFIHPVYRNTIISSFYEKIMPYCGELLDIKALIRIKINMYPNNETLKEHGMHFDYSFSHKAAILSINTCDGYTKLEDGTKIDSVANRMLLFDASRPHTSTNTTNQVVRVNINFNYF